MQRVELKGTLKVRHLKKGQNALYAQLFCATLRGCADFYPFKLTSLLADLNSTNPLFNANFMLNLR